MERVLEVTLATTLLAATGFATDSELSSEPPLPAPKQQTLPEGQSFVVSSLPITIYGYIKADLAYDTSAKTNNGEYARWVDPGSDGDGQFIVTARQTRLGMKIAGPTVSGAKTSGCIEIDFYGGGASNSAANRLRHAYADLGWKEADFSLLAGQTSDVVSPLVMPTVNYTVAWWTGDIGFRRNQVRATKGFAFGDDTKLLLQAAATRSAGGEDRGAPGWQGRAALSFPGIQSRKTTVGVSGLTAPELNGAAHVDAAAVAADLTVPVLEGLTFTGEWFSGENLDSYVGGISQGLNHAGKELGSWGFWTAASWKFATDWKANVGYAMEEMDDADLDGTGLPDGNGVIDDFRKRNSTLFGNISYSLNEATTIGFEVAQLNTEYQIQPDADSTRFQLAITFAF